MDTGTNQKDTWSIFNLSEKVFLLYCKNATRRIISGHIAAALATSTNTFILPVDNCNPIPSTAFSLSRRLSDFRQTRFA